MCESIRQKQQRQIYNQDTYLLESCCLLRAWGFNGPAKHARCGEKQIVGEYKQDGIEL